VSPSPAQGWERSLVEGSLSRARGQSWTVVRRVPIALDVVIASRKALEPLWSWVLLSVLFPRIMLIVLLIVPARRDPRGTV
jgi:hypothetical protein